MFYIQIILCDECHNGYHMVCLKPPLTVLPDDDWYCPSCKRDPNDVIAPGASKQAKKSNTSKTNRDWGRGMACVGRLLYNVITMLCILYTHIKNI